MKLEQRWKPEAEAGSDSITHHGIRAVLGPELEDLELETFAWYSDAEVLHMIADLCPSIREIRFSLKMLQLSDSNAVFRRLNDACPRLELFESCYFGPSSDQEDEVEEVRSWGPSSVVWQELRFRVEISG